MKKFYIISLIIVFIVGAGILSWYFYNLQNNPEKQSRIQNQDKSDYKILSINESYFKFKDEFTEEEYQKILSKLKDKKINLERSPQSPIDWFDFGYYKNRLGDKEGARLAWEKSFEYNPKKLATSNNLGDLYAHYYENYERAEFFYIYALNIKPNYSVYRKLLDLYRYKLEKKQNKVESLALEAIENIPDREKGFLMYLYDFYEDQNNQEKMKEYEARIKEIDPEFKG